MPVKSSKEVLLVKQDIELKLGTLSSCKEEINDSLSNWHDELLDFQFFLALKWLPCVAVGKMAHGTHFRIPSELYTYTYVSYTELCK